MIEYKNDWFEVIHDRKYYYINEPNSHNGAGVLLKYNRNFVLIYHKRQAIKQFSIEIPRGYGERDETSEECAIRETYEETGFLLKKEEILFLGYMYPNNGILSSKISLYYGETDRQSCGIKDRNEVNTTVVLDELELKKKIKEGSISDSFTICAYTLFKLNI